MTQQKILDRLAKLGLHADDLPTDSLCSATSALVCMPMYMVSNVHGWTEDRQFVVPLLNVHGLEAVRESFAIGAEKSSLDIEKAHSKVLDDFLAHARPSDLIVYEYAVETLRQFLAIANDAIAERIRAMVGQSMVNVAQAAGKQLFGSGDRVSDQERECITAIAKALELGKSEKAAASLAAIGV